MSGTLYRFFAEDHDRLDGLLQHSITKAGTIDRGVYAEFRAGLLKHISMEEKVLLPAAQGLRGGEPLAMAATLRLDHSVLSAFAPATMRPCWKNGARVECAQQTQQLVSNTRPRQSRALCGDGGRYWESLLRAIVRSQGCSGMS
jgi:hypothetical protein